MVEARESKILFPESAWEEGIESLLVGESSSLIIRQSLAALIELGLDITAVTVAGGITGKTAT